MSKNMSKNNLVSLVLVIAVLVSILNNTSTITAASKKQIRVNNTMLEFNEIIYVDGTNGDDTSGDGSKTAPFKSVVKGFDCMNTNCKQDGAVVVANGEYDVSGLFTPANENINSKYNGLKLSIISETLGGVKFLDSREWHLTQDNKNYRIKLKFYGIIISSEYTHGHLGGDNWINEYYNCVFDCYYGGFNDIISSTEIYAENCIFTGKKNNCYTKHPITGTALNCASTTQDMDPIKGKRINSLYNVMVDSDYNITSSGWQNAGQGTNPDGSTAHIGVYGGQFAWGSKVSEVNNILKVVLEVNEELQLSVDDDLNENLNMTWTSSENSVATVATNGVVKAISPGNTMITVLSSDGSYVDTINVLVVDDADDLRLAIDLKEGESCRLTIDDLTDTVPTTWNSLNSDIVTVTSKGRVTAKSKGLTLITATDVEGNIIGQVYVRVRK